MGYLTEATVGGSDYKLAGALYGTCGTAAATAAKVVTLAAFDSLETGVTIHVKFTYSNTASNATMNVNSTGAKNLCRYGTTRVGTTERASWKAGAVVSFTYDGTSWVQNDYLEDTGVTTDTKNTAGATDSSSKLYLIGATAQTANPQTYSNLNVYEKEGDVYAANYWAVDSQSNIGTFNGLKINASMSVPYVTPTLTYVSSASGMSNSSLTWSGDYTLGAACAKGVDTSISSGSTSTNVPTSAAVASLVASMQAGAATFQGTLVASGGDGSTSWTEAQLEAASYKKGWYWVCATGSTSTPATFAGKVLEAGDMLFCVSDKGSAYAASDFAAVQNNIETLTNAEIDALWAAA